MSIFLNGVVAKIGDDGASIKLSDVRGGWQKWAASGSAAMKLPWVSKFEELKCDSGGGNSNGTLVALRKTLLMIAVPLACVAYYPVLAVLGKPDPLGAPAWLGTVSPLAGFAFLALAFGAWRIGVRHYTSTGS